MKDTQTDSIKLFAKITFQRTKPTHFMKAVSKPFGVIFTLENNAKIQIHG